MSNRNLPSAKISPEEDFYDDDIEDYRDVGDDYDEDVTSQSNVKSYQPRDNILSKYSNKMNFDLLTYDQQGASRNILKEQDKKENDERFRLKDKKDRATREQVLDSNTDAIIRSLLRKNTISSIDGCISTGKEANVYYASKDTKEYAVKIYKTSILTFKDRDKYVSGEFRFRNGYAKSNPRKMVRLWAEKEMRNLKRLYDNGLNAPEPIELKLHVLVMDFIGEREKPAPKLKDVELNQSKARQLYRDIVIMMWKMYNKCKLVHGDLSEFNILYFKGEAYIIDVSQSVEHDNGMALQFLRQDCANVSKFFKKNGVATMSLKDMFNFITDANITEKNLEECLDALSEKAANTELTVEEQIEEEAFKEQYIPKRLNEVKNYERDINNIKSGEVDQLIYQQIVGLKSDLSGVASKPEILKKEITDGESDSCSDEDEESEQKKSLFKDSSRPKDETSEEKKARKKAVKEAQADKRKSKIKKHIKKRLVKGNNK
ncbi:serine/threonine-protein kinase RIO1 [Coccinella septempunctata]|uniref:serine/threonine-protein kinase RIO1 n=1 Tax=Coccinella septempunctata TaxID=41139 RepID=UPI001D08CEA1|nr:serine/threonine-protein kinase RIO1 [Coccinella septempunctata]